MQITVTVDLSKGKKVAMAELNAFFNKWNTEDDAEVVTKGKRGRPAKTAAPEDTVSDDEDEDFGSKPLTKKQLKAKAEADESEDDESDDDTDESDESDEDADESDEDDSDDEAEVSFDEVKKAINKYGEKKPEDMKAILAGFNIKSTKQLEGLPKKWQPVYRKVMAKLSVKKAK